MVKPNIQSAQATQSDNVEPNQPHNGSSILTGIFCLACFPIIYLVGKMITKFFS